MAAGYSSPSYAETLGHVGVPVNMAGTMFLRRTVQGSGTDLVAPYPLLRCHDWDDLGCALDDEHIDLTVTGVTDPFSDPGPDVLDRVFRDLVRPWKLHHVVRVSDTSGPASHHRRNLRKVAVEVERASAPQDIADDFVHLYDVLRERHSVTGAADFSDRSLVEQLAVPGASAWVARADGVGVGAVVTYTDGDVAWYHLGAASTVGYERRAMFGLFDAMIADLRDDGVQLLDLGAGAGADGASTGLERFKRGWADEQLPTHLVGRILDRTGTQAAIERSGGPFPWFPAYGSSAG